MRTDSEDDQQQAEGHGRRPGGAEHHQHDRFGDAEDQPGAERAGHAAQAGEHHHAEGAADVEPVQRRLDRADDDQHRARERAHAGGDAERPLLDAHRVGAHQAQRRLVLRHRLDGAAGEGLR